LLGIEEQLARAALADFRGLPHRLEHVRSARGVDFVNDSKSTAPQATSIALRALCDEDESREGREGKGTAACAQAERRIILIVGGQDKPEPLEDMPAEVARHCRAVIGMGECGERFAAAIRKASEGNCLIIENVPGLEQAVTVAARLAREGETVLFSPGAPSFDAYKNFAERGEHFVLLVKSLG
jgi:UDP-N-acetylmuramoylalanine--D-glutamate ligase